MALTNAEKQRRWRQHHAERRRAVARIASMLTRRSHSEGHVEEIAIGLRAILNKDAIAALRRALRPFRPPTKKETEARWREESSARRELWLAEHPDRTADEFEHLK